MWKAGKYDESFGKLLEHFVTMIAPFAASESYWYSIFHTKVADKCIEDK